MKRVAKSREERREEIIDVAKNLFLEKGYDNTAVSDIVKALNIAQGTFYYHFKSKTEVLAAVTRKIVSVTENRLRDISETEDLDTVTRMEAAIHTLLETLHINEDILKLMYNESNSLMREQLLKNSLEAYAPFLTKIIDDGVKNKKIKAHHPIETSEIIVLVISSYFRLYVSTEDPSRLKRIRDTLEQFIVSLIGGHSDAVR